MKKTILFSLLFCLSIYSWAEKYSSTLNTFLIPEQLKKNACATVRENDVFFEYSTPERGTLTEKIILTILNEKGKDYAHFRYPGDKYRTLKSFSGAMYDASGKLQRKFKRSDILSSEWSPHLATGDLHYFMNVEPSSFPFTVVFEYQVEYKNGILMFPSFAPQSNSNISVQQSSYTLTVPVNTIVAQKAFNCDPLKKVKTEKGNDVYTVAATDIPAFESEIFMPEAHNFYPIVLARPQDFVYDKVPGQIIDWKTLGNWQHKLWEDRNTLDEPARRKIHELVANAVTDFEKVKILYDYLGETTHYQNISLGIGGFQPMAASEVCRIGFGDCKGLTNYLHSMLKEIGINSHPTLIATSDRRKNIFSDYANFTQFNHVILQVSLPDDTIWLETTNPELPFGYIHDNISGHQALVVTDTGGELIRLPEYPDSLSVDRYVSEITVNSDGSAKAKTINTNKVKTYDRFSYFTKLKSNEQMDKMRAIIKLPNATVTNVCFTEEKTATPNLDIHVDWHTSSYGTKTGSRLFLPINPLRAGTYDFKKKERTFDIQIADGFKNEDMITLTIPEDYEVEAAPNSIQFESPFGKFSSTILTQGNKLTIHQSLITNRGYWAANKYEELIAFFESVNSAYKGKIIIKSR